MQENLLIVNFVLRNKWTKDLKQNKIQAKAHYEDETRRKNENGIGMKAHTDLMQLVTFSSTKHIQRSW